MEKNLNKIVIIRKQRPSRIFEAMLERTPEKRPASSQIVKFRTLKWVRRVCITSYESTRD